MKKVFSIIAITMLVAVNLNATTTVKPSCSDLAFDAAEANYDIFEDSFLAGIVFNVVYNDCMGIGEI